MKDYKTNPNIKKQAQELARTIMKCRTGGWLFSSFGLRMTDWYDDLDVDGLDLGTDIIERLRSNGYGTIGSVLSAEPKNLRRKEGMEEHMEEVIGAVAEYVLEDRALLSAYAAKNDLPLYRILRYEDIRQYRNVPVDIYAEEWDMRDCIEVPRAARYSRVVTLYEFLKLDLTTIRGMILTYRSDNKQNMPAAVSDHDLLFNYLVRLDMRLKKFGIPPECRYLTLLDTDDDPQPVTYPINPFWQHRIRTLLDRHIAGKEVSLKGLPPAARAAYKKAAEAMDICGTDVFDGILEDPDYSGYFAECLGYHVTSTLRETELCAWLRTYLYGIPESIRDRKVSEVIKYYDLYEDLDHNYLAGAMDKTLYGYFSAYVDSCLSNDLQEALKARPVNEFLKWAGSAGMEQVIQETFTSSMGDRIPLLDGELEEMQKVVELRSAGMTRKEAGAKIGITNMKVAAVEKNIDWCLWHHINEGENHCIHDLVAVYFLLNPGAKTLDRKTLEGLLGPGKAFVYWNYIQRNYEDLTNSLYAYSPDKDSIHLKRTRKKTADLPVRLDFDDLM
ncbi:MAG: hypothetical protein LUE27_02745 [Clostridia bacterium]|nr:hypothetical protein [Clostridia bacterium]